MWNIFALSNYYFSLNVFASLTLLAVSWLYYDAYKALNNRRELWKVLGFIILSISFLFRGMDLSGISLSEISNYQLLFKNIDVYLRVIGYTLLVIGLLVDPLQPKPATKKVGALILVTFPSLLFLSPVVASIVAILYLRRASVGLERHIYPPAISFFFLAIYELLFSLNSFQSSTNLNLFKLVSPFGPIWITQTVVLLIAIFVLGRWVFRYLLKQFQSQIFMIQMALVLIIYLIVTVGFTGLLINNLKSQILNELKSQAKVLEFAFDAKRAELASTAKLLVQTSQVQGSEPLRYDSLVIFDKDGVVTYRAEDTERKGDSISGDPVVKKVLLGKETSSVVVKDGVVAPTVMLIAGVPVVTGGEVTGGVMIGELIDNSYIEGFTKLTGLRVGVYGNDTLTAGGTVGIKEGNKDVKEKVLVKGENYVAETRWLNTPYLSVYAPLLDSDNNPVGMYFVGRPQIEVLGLATKTLEIVFIGTIILLFLSMIPSKLIAKSIAKQIK